MNRIAVAQKLVKLAREMTGKEDSPEDIAMDVVTRMSTGMQLDDAFKAIGYGDLWPYSRAIDVPDDFFEMDKGKKLKALTKAIEKALKRQKGGHRQYSGSTAVNHVKFASEILKLARELTASEVVNEMARQIVHFSSVQKKALTKVFGRSWLPSLPMIKENDNTIVAKYKTAGKEDEMMAGFRLEYDAASDTYDFTPFSVVVAGRKVKWGRKSEGFYVEDLGDTEKLVHLFESVVS